MISLIFFLTVCWMNLASKNADHEGRWMHLSLLIFAIMHHRKVYFLCFFVISMENPLSLPFSLLPSAPFSSPSSFSGSLTEKLIEGQKSPDTSLLLPDLLTLTDSFNTAAESTTNGTSYVLVPCFAPKKFLICSAYVFLPFLFSNILTQSGISSGKGTKKMFFFLFCTTNNVFVLLFYVVFM